MASVTENLDFPFSLIFVLMVLARRVLDSVSSSIALESLFFWQLAGDPSSVALQRRVGFRELSPVTAPRDLPRKEQCFSAGEWQDRTPSSKSQPSPLFLLLLYILNQCYISQVSRH